MELTFNCPRRRQSFSTAAFTVTENRGTVTDPSGTRSLDARVALTDPCPFCGEKHSYHAAELSCPFDLTKPSSQAAREEEAMEEDPAAIKLTRTVIGSG